MNVSVFLSILVLLMYAWKSTVKAQIFMIDEMKVYNIFLFSVCYTYNDQVFLFPCE